MEREAYFDNAKFLLIFLVVFGHIIQPFTADSAGINTLYMWVYTFHMPAFIFLAGFFAKGSGNMDYILKLAKKLLMPYIIFQLTFTAYFLFIGRNTHTDIFYPHWSLWFLLSLFCWHILLIFFKKIPPFIGVSLALGIGVVIGYFSEIGHQYSLSRTFVFFPFFLLGYWLTKKQVMVLKKTTVKVLSIAVMSIVAFLIYIAPDFSVGWLLASKSYVDLGFFEFGGAARLLVYMIAAVMSISVLAWIPTKEYSWTKLGQRTLYVYLLHGFFVQFFRVEGLFEVAGLFDVIFLAGLSLMIVLLLSSRPIQGISQPAIEGKATILRKYVSSLK